MILQVPRAVRKKKSEGPRGAHPWRQQAFLLNHWAGPGSATNLPSRETCHPPGEQTATHPKPLLRLQPAGKTSSSYRGPPPSWLLPLLPLILSPGIETLSPFSSTAPFTPSWPCLLHIPLLQEVHHGFSPAPSCWLLNSSPILSPAQVPLCTNVSSHARAAGVAGSYSWYLLLLRGFTGSSAGKESTCNTGIPGLIPELGRSLGEGTGYPLHYSWSSLVAQTVKNRPAMWETWVQSLD